MTIADQSLLEIFDGLTKRERQEAAVEILRRAALTEGELTDDAPGWNVSASARLARPR